MKASELNYVAIDFETATPEKCSICSIGIVTIIGGVTMEKYFTLVQPPRNEYSDYCISIHGTKPCHTANAPTFLEIYPEIKRRLANQTVIAHNAKGVEYHCLNNAMRLNNISEDLNITWIDTLDIYKKSLKAICEDLQVPLNHHDPLSDANACAEIYKMYIEHGHSSEIYNSPRKKLHVKEQKQVEQTEQSEQAERTYKREHKTLDPEFDHEDNPFIKKKIVISGLFTTWTDRDELCDLLEILGARVSGSVSKTTNILVVGINAGGKKIEQMNENINSGKDSIILNENGIIEMLSDCGLEYNKVDLPIDDKSSLTETITTQQWTQAYYERYELENKDKTTESNKIENHSLNLLDDIKENPFKKKRIVISGNFISWSRESLQNIFESLGAVVSSSVSSSTNIFVAGMYVGDKKVEQMNENIRNGKDAVILNENGIIEMLLCCGVEYEKVELPIGDGLSLTEYFTRSTGPISYKERKNI